MSNGLFDSIAPSDESLPFERLLLTAAAIAAGHRGRDAVTEADDALSILRGSKPERRRSAHQESVRQIERLYAEFHQAPPKPAVIASWIKKAGGPDALSALIYQLGNAGHLEKGVAYVYGAIKSAPKTMAQGQQEARAAGTQGIKDGTELPSGLIWSASLGEAVTKESWRELIGQ